jgi:hypothetical protein
MTSCSPIHRTMRGSHIHGIVLTNSPHHVLIVHAMPPSARAWSLCSVHSTTGTMGRSKADELRRDAGRASESNKGHWRKGQPRLCVCVTRCTPPPPRARVHSLLIEHVQGVKLAAVVALCNHKHPGRDHCQCHHPPLISFAARPPRHRLSHPRLPSSLPPSLPSVRPPVPAHPDRNVVKALPWFSTVRAKLDDPAYSGFFLKFTTSHTNYSVPQCAPEDPTKCSVYYHDQEQTPEVPTAAQPNPDGKCTDGVCDCGTQPCGEYLWDHRNGSMLRDFIVNELFLNAQTGLGNPAISGVCDAQHHHTACHTQSLIALSPPPPLPRAQAQFLDASICPTAHFETLRLIHNHLLFQLTCANSPLTRWQFFIDDFWCSNQLCKETNNTVGGCPCGDPVQGPTEEDRHSQVSDLTENCCCYCSCCCCFCCCVFEVPALSWRACASILL